MDKAIKDKILNQILLDESLGFKKVFPDEVDKEYYYIRTDIEHPLLKGLHIIIDNKINVYCKEIKENLKKNKYGYDVLIISEELTSKKLIEIIDTIQYNWAYAKNLKK